MCVFSNWNRRNAIALKVLCILHLPLKWFYFAVGESLKSTGLCLVSVQAIVHDSIEFITCFTSFAQVSVPMCENINKCRNLSFLLYISFSIFFFVYVENQWNVLRGVSRRMYLIYLATFSFCKWQTIIIHIQRNSIGMNATKTNNVKPNGWMNF